MEKNSNKFNLKIFIIVTIIICIAIFAIAYFIINNNNKVISNNTNAKSKNQLKANQNVTTNINSIENKTNANITTIITNTANTANTNNTSINANVDEKSNTNVNVNEETNKANNSSYNYNDIKEFWTNFRKAVLLNNYEEIERFVNFPLKTRGPYDTDPVIEVKQEEFKSVFTKFLQQKDGEDVMEYDWIKENEMPRMLGGEDYDNASNHINLVRLEENVADFKYMQMAKDSNGYWRLSMIYTLE